MEENKSLLNEALEQLPLPQRLVTIALRSVYEKIKELSQQEELEIEKNHIQFINKFKVIEQKSSEIIRGREITQDDLKGQQIFFTASEQTSLKNAMKQKKGIKQYWLITISNSQFQKGLKDLDKQILSNVQDISSNVTMNSMQVTIVIKTNKIVPAGSYTRKLLLENGLPIKMQGDIIEIKNKQESFLMKSLFRNTEISSELGLIFDFIGSLINQIIPYSLQYYLGVNENESDSQDIEDQQQQQQQSSQSQDNNHNNK